MKIEHHNAPHRSDIQITLRGSKEKKSVGLSRLSRSFAKLVLTSPETNIKRHDFPANLNFSSNTVCTLVILFITVPLNHVHVLLIYNDLSNTGEYASVLMKNLSYCV